MPGAALGLLIASILGLLFHLARGGSLPRLALYVMTAWISFFAGQFVSSWIGWEAWRVGTLNLLPAFLATGIGLTAATILAGPERHRTRGARRRATPLDDE